MTIIQANQINNSSESGKLKVAFFGTSDKSEVILEALHKNFNLVLCVTKDDTKVGRKQEVRKTKVREWAEKHDISFVTIDNLKGEKLAVIVKALIENKVQVGVVADFNYIIPSEILSSVEFGLINVHFSKLPKYRGASPVQHTILSGEKFAGVTLQLMDDGMDTGDILHQFEYELLGTENTLNLYNILFEKAANILPQVLNDYIAGKIKPIKQNQGAATYCFSKSHPKSTYIYKEDAEIDWNTMTAIEIDRMVRAFYPWPVTWTTLEKMHNSGIVKAKNPSPLRIKIYKTKLQVDAPARLNIEEIQVEGKGITGWNDFLNGYTIKA